MVIFNSYVKLPEGTYPRLTGSPGSPGSPRSPGSPHLQRRGSARFRPFRGRFLRLPPGPKKAGVAMGNLWAMEVSFSLGNQLRDVPTSHV